MERSKEIDILLDVLKNRISTEAKHLEDDMSSRDAIQILTHFRRSIADYINLTIEKGSIGALKESLYTETGGIKYNKTQELAKESALVASTGDDIDKVQEYIDKSLHEKADTDVVIDTMDGKMKEIMPRSINVYDNLVNGCKKYKKEIMISMAADGQFFDIFLTDEQAKTMINEIGIKRIRNMKRNDA